MCSNSKVKKERREIAVHTHEGVKQSYRIALASYTVVSVVCIKYGKSEKLAKESPHSLTSATSHH